MTNNKPNSVANLNKALHRISKDDPEFLVIRDYFASIVVAQMLEGCVIKGGSSLKIRYGSDNTRYTNDLDAALSVDENTFIDNLRVNLSKGWENFTGKIIIREKAHPKHIPEQYVMQPYDIKLMYLGKPFCTVRLETTHNEIDDAKVCERLFSYRKMHQWPPKIIKGDNWDALYANYNDIDNIEHDLDKAIEWANELIISVSR